MNKKLLIILCLVLGCKYSYAQHTPQAAYDKFIQLTQMFHGSQPYSCYAIAEVKYKADAKAIKDTSRLIYRNGSTYYKSKRVEHVEAPEGELVINHELKTAMFNVSDSLKEAVQKEFNVKRDKDFESMLDSNFEERDAEAFRKFVVEQCNITWAPKGDLEEITFTPRNSRDALLLSMKIRFSADSKVRYYEYVNRESYAKDLNGNTRFRIVTTIYDNFTYNNVPNIPSKLSDFLEWNGWTIKLKRYTNYKLTLL